MKRKSIIGMMLIGMMMGMFSTSCQDMLSPSSERHAYEVAKDTLYSYWGILKSLQNIAERYVILNECRGDLVDASGFVSDTIGAIVNFGEVKDPEKNWKDGACTYLRISDYYHVINSCNAYIAMCDTALTTGTNKKYLLKEYSQVQAIRAWVYMQLLYAYGENRVPFYKEPMLTTDDINNFLADKNHKKVSAQTLVDELGPDLEKMEPVEVNILLSDQTEDQRQYTYQGMLEYYNYGDVNSSNSHFVCHSSKCLFPVSIVLGDLYLLAGNYERAARHYYNYINTETCGPLPVDKFYSTGLRDDSNSDPLIYEYDSRNIPYTEKGAVSKSTEAITCIPSNKGKLEGRVLTDINRLFGFEAQMTTSSSEEGSTYVGLSRNYERELIPSAGYEALCNSQKYEIYEGNFSGSNEDWKTCQIRELPNVGDARRAWIYASRGKQWTFTVGDDVQYGKMVTKQNPGGAFSTTYPVVYRRSTIWLRYAEALNRAGFPAYAFAILKTGLCTTDQDGNKWYPINPQDVFAQYQKEPKALNADPQYDYPVKEDERIYCYCIGKNDKNEEIYVPEDWIDGTQLHSIDELKTWMTDYYQQQFDAYNAEHPDEPMESPEALPDPFESDPMIRFAPASEKAFGNIPIKSCNAACYYIPLRELQQASNSYFLNFRSSQTYLHGPNKSQTIYVKDEGKLLDGSRITKSYGGSSSGSANYTMGVHQRGCGFILYNDPENCRSSYNYVEQVASKLKDEYDDATIKAAYSQYESDDDRNAFLAALEAYIYDDANLANVQKAVEDLIIDEMGLELAFEGTRFSDLCRVAMRRNDNNYLAKRVAKRHTGTIDPALQSRLMVRDNWFLPIPE